MGFIYGINDNFQGHLPKTDSLASWLSTSLHVACMPDWSLSQDSRKKVCGRFPAKFRFYYINEAHKQYSLLDTIFSYIFYLGPPGKHL